ncbi:unnamed protein product, partial [Ixodes pacificus]
RLSSGIRTPPPLLLLTKLHPRRPSRRLLRGPRPRSASPPSPDPRSPSLAFPRVPGFPAGLGELPLRCIKRSSSPVFSPSSGFFFCILRLSIALDGFSFFSPIWGTSIPETPIRDSVCEVASILARAVFCALVSRRPSAFALSLLSFSFCFLRSLRSCSCFN